MPFPDVPRTLLQYYATHTAPNESIWYGGWNAILNILFPVADGFLINHRTFVDESAIPNFIFEVSKIAEVGGPGLQLVLVVQIKNTHQWPDGEEHLFAQICKQTNLALSPAASKKLYWIGVIGPHWRYGSKEDDCQPGLTPLIPWHDTTHDDASFNDLRTLAELVRVL
jgi:hypothetical protein